MVNLTPLNDSQMIQLINEHETNLIGPDILNEKLRQHIENKKFNKLKTPDDIAEHYGLTYDSTVEFHSFIDEKFNCRIIIPKVLTDGKKPFLGIGKKGQTMYLANLIRSYSETPVNMKKATDEILFLNKQSPKKGGHKDALSFWDMVDGKSTVFVYSLSALPQDISGGYAIERQLLHEMGHAVHLNPKNELKETLRNEIKNVKDYYNCSDYAYSKKGIAQINEVIAEGMSMVAYKKRSDKNTAYIKVPIFENNKYSRYEIIGYDEWHKRYHELAELLDKYL